MADPRRRLLLGLSAAAVAAAALPLAWRRHASRGDAVVTGTGLHPSQHATPLRFQRALRVPGRSGLLAERTLEAPLQLVAQRAGFRVFDGAPTEVWHYACMDAHGAGANPLLRVRRGGTLDVTLVNRLDQPTTIHWHGLHVDEANDGSGLHPVAPGTRRRYRVPVGNRAGLYWYHAHPHARTGRQLHGGLAGLLLVEDDEERALRRHLGLRWGERDLPLLIADKQVDRRNALVYRAGADDWIGNRVLVNWTPEPYLDIGPCRYRLRIANVCNARVLRLAFVHEGQPLPFQLIGTDGGLLARAWTSEDLFLAPAQRADVLVDFRGLPAGARVRLRSLDYDAMEHEDESGALAPAPMGEHPGAVPMGTTLDLMELRVEHDAPARDPPLPATLSTLAPPPDTDGWPVRPLRLRMDRDGTWFINDWNFHRSGHAPAFSVRRGAREVWEIRNNMTSMPHPIHVHGLQFRVVGRAISPVDLRARAVAGRGLGAQDLGFTDTVLVWPGEIVRLALDFAQPFRGPQRYMLHCHNLEHEDQGMMATFAVVD